MADRRHDNDGYGLAGKESRKCRHPSSQQVRSPSPRLPAARLNISRSSSYPMVESSSRHAFLDSNGTMLDPVKDGTVQAATAAILAATQAFSNAS